MHKNSLVKFTAILFTFISILQISYTYVVSKIEKDALNYSITQISDQEKDFSIKRELVQWTYLDSVANIRVFGITPDLMTVTFIGSAFWMLACMVVGVKSALDYNSLWRAFGVVIVAWLIQAFLLIIILVLFRNF